MNASFGWAVNQLKAGRKVKRVAWEKVLFLSNDKLYIGTEDGQHLEPWTSDAMDILAEDWTSVPRDKPQEKTDNSGAW